ncbi:hypothetical protein H2200_006456 [Cladophialophora chaetospira]|uniref:Uncharacterized protein n=1 Tax=Cladophialophora chaetospira TaxID=386627 RepID=A0AA39CHP6_9EURO|nr:hypothetical protein H2200_006456 [Cladophialophora chaetospira]
MTVRFRSKRLHGYKYLPFARPFDLDPMLTISIFESQNNHSNTRASITEQHRQHLNLFLLSVFFHSRTTEDDEYTSDEPMDDQYYMDYEFHDNGPGGWHQPNTIIHSTQRGSGLRVPAVGWDEYKSLLDRVQVDGNIEYWHLVDRSRGFLSGQQRLRSTGPRDGFPWPLMGYNAKGYSLPELQGVIGRFYRDPETGDFFKDYEGYKTDDRARFTYTENDGLTEDRVHGDLVDDHGRVFHDPMPEIAHLVARPSELNIHFSEGDGAFIDEEFVFKHFGYPTQADDDTFFTAPNIFAIEWLEHRYLLDPRSHPYRRIDDRRTDETRQNLPIVGAVNIKWNMIVYNGLGQPTDKVVTFQAQAWVVDARLSIDDRNRVDMWVGINGLGVTTGLYWSNLREGGVQLGASKLRVHLPNDEVVDNRHVRLSPRCTIQNGQILHEDGFQAGEGASLGPGALFRERPQNDSVDEDEDDYYEDDDSDDGDDGPPDPGAEFREADGSIGFWGMNQIAQRPL